MQSACVPEEISIQLGQSWRYLGALPGFQAQGALSNMSDRWRAPVTSQGANGPQLGLILVQSTPLGSIVCGVQPIASEASQLLDLPLL